MEQLGSKHYDLWSFMDGRDKHFRSSWAGRSRTCNQYIPVFLLLNSNTDLALSNNEPDRLTWIEHKGIRLEWRFPRFFFRHDQLPGRQGECGKWYQNRYGVVHTLVEDSPTLLFLYRSHAVINIVLEQTKTITWGCGPRMSFTVYCGWKARPQDPACFNIWRSCLYFQQV